MLFTISLRQAVVAFLLANPLVLAQLHASPSDELMSRSESDKRGLHHYVGDIVQRQASAAAGDDVQDGAQDEQSGENETEDADTAAAPAAAASEGTASDSTAAADTETPDAVDPALPPVVAAATTTAVAR